MCFYYLFVCQCDAFVCFQAVAEIVFSERAMLIGIVSMANREGNTAHAQTAAELARYFCCFYVSQCNQMCS